MNFRHNLYISLVLLTLTVAGCKTSTPAPSTGPGPNAQVRQRDSAIEPAESHRSRSRPEANSQVGDFDFYLFNLSWSPEFCATHPTSHECASRPGFVIHGLWPQNSDGTYPENCSTLSGPTNPEAFLNLLPTVSLIEHEWATHGTCSGLNPDAYFTAVREAYRTLQIPSTFSATQTPPLTLTPDEILKQFTQANPSFPPGSFALSCGNNYLTAVEACFDKNLHPTACQGIHSCGATVVKIAPRFIAQPVDQ